MVLEPVAIVWRGSLVAGAFTPESLMAHLLRGSDLYTPSAGRVIGAQAVCEASAYAIDEAQVLAAPEEAQWALHVARDATRGLSPGRDRVGLIVASETPLCDLIMPALGLGGPSLQLAGHDDAGAHALMLATSWLQHDRASAVVVVAAQRQSEAHPEVCEGAVALTLMRLVDARALGLKVAGLLRAIGASSPRASRDDARARAALLAMQRAQLNASAISVVIGQTLDAAEQAALQDLFGAPARAPALSSAHHSLGPLGALTGLLGAVIALGALERDKLPARRDGAHEVAAWPPQTSPRVALVLSAYEGASAATLIEEDTGQLVAPRVHQRLDRLRVRAASARVGDEALHALARAALTTQPLNTRATGVAVLEAGLRVDLTGASLDALMALEAARDLAAHLDATPERVALITDLGPASAALIGAQLELYGPRVMLRPDASSPLDALEVARALLNADLARLALVVMRAGDPEVDAALTLLLSRTTRPQDWAELTWPLDAPTTRADAPYGAGGAALSAILSAHHGRAPDAPCALRAPRHDMALVVTPVDKRPAPWRADAGAPLAWAPAHQRALPAGQVAAIFAQGCALDVAALLDAAPELEVSDPGELVSEDGFLSGLVRAARAQLVAHAWLAWIGARPQLAAAEGLSGAVCALLALGWWGDLAQYLRDAEQSQLLSRDLGDALDAVRLWLFRQGARDAAFSATPWARWRLEGAQVVVSARDAIAYEPLTMLTRVAGPDHATLEGEPEACRRVVARLIEGAQASELTLRHPVLHARACVEVDLALETLHRRPTAQVPGCALWLNGAPVMRDAAAIARAMREVALRCVDLPAIVESLWREGARVFICYGGAAQAARVTQCLGERDARVIALEDPRDAAVALWEAGVRVDQERVMARFGQPAPQPTRWIAAPLKPAQPQPASDALDPVSAAHDAPVTRGEGEVAQPARSAPPEPHGGADEAQVTQELPALSVAPPAQTRPVPLAQAASSGALDEAIVRARDIAQRAEQRLNAELQAHREALERALTSQR